MSRALGLHTNETATGNHRMNWGLLLFIVGSLALILGCAAMFDHVRTARVVYSLIAGAVSLALFVGFTLLVFLAVVILGEDALP